MNKKTTKQTAARAAVEAGAKAALQALKKGAPARKAKAQALKKEAAAFFKNDYPKILRAQRVYEYPCSAYELTGHETCAFRNFIIRAGKANQWDGRSKWDSLDLLCELEDMLYNEYPEAHTAWAKIVKETAVRLGYCSWAKKHPKAAADLF